MCLEVHVDDFYAVGPGDSAGQLLKRMAKYMTLTLEGPFDVGSTFVHLKRVRTVTPEGLYISATSSHLKKLLKLTDLTENSKGKDTPITKSVVEDGDEPTAELSPEETTRFRAVVGILMYMSTDRPDIQYVVNELSGAMSKPTQRSWEAAKDLVRYLIRTKGYALFFDREVNNCDDVVVMTDSDWATDRQSRRSKSASHIYVGNCLLYSFTRRQTVVAQSSAEAEYYATTSGVSEGILIRKVLAFFNLPLGLRSVTDSAANNAMAHRLGVGKVRHLETKVLWLQHLVYNGFLTMSWSPGKYNNSDQGTKVLQKARFQELVKMTGLRDLEENDVKIQQVVNVLAQNAGPSKEQVGQALATLVGWLQVQQASGLETESEDIRRKFSADHDGQRRFPDRIIGRVPHDDACLVVETGEISKADLLQRANVCGPSPGQGVPLPQEDQEGRGMDAVPMVQQGQAQNRLTCSPLFTLVNSSYALEKRRAQY